MGEPLQPSDDHHKIPPGRRRTLASRRSCVVTGVVAAGIGGWINGSAGAGVGRTIFGALFLGMFTGYGLWLVTKARKRVRPDVADPDLRDPSSPPPTGGWANPTGPQMLTAKLRRALSGLSRRGPHH